MVRTSPLSRFASRSLRMDSACCSVCLEDGSGVGMELSIVSVGGMILSPSIGFSCSEALLILKSSLCSSSIACLCAFHDCGAVGRDAI